MTAPALAWRVCPQLRRGLLAGLVLGAIVAPYAVTPLGHVMAVSPATATVVFPGPSRGTAGSQAPTAHDFLVHCNVAVSTDAGKVGTTAIPVGSALEATAGCGVATLLLISPGPGQFHAMLGVAADDTSGQAATVRMRVIGGDGYDRGFATVTTTQAAGAKPIDVDVSKATVVILSFSGAPKAFLYGFKLSGAARTVRPVAQGGNALPAGATPLSLSGAAYSCNAQVASTSTPLSVSGVTIPAAGAATATGCGLIALNVPSGARGVLALRFGAADTSTGGLLTISVRVLAADGHLLRKAIGVTYLGGGLRPLWVDLQGAQKVTIEADGSTDTTVALTAFGIVPGTFATYRVSDRTISARSANASTAVDPAAFVSQCNSSVGTADITVGHAPVYAGAYFSTYSCGTSSFSFCCTPSIGHFHALFGAPDNASASSNLGPPSATVVVLDRSNHPLRRLTVRARPGAPGVPIDVSVNGASVLSFLFSGSTGALYDMRLSGVATISDLVYPPTAPPVNPPTGTAIDPRAFTLHCNTYLATSDLRLVGATTLEGWAIYGEACGEADLALGNGRYPGHDFNARIGIKLGESPATVVGIRLNVLNAAGKVIRHSDQTARYGYGSQPIHVSLTGGKTLQIVWSQSTSTTVVYAMTAS